ncbi:sulfotransferase family 2 domain-containing protein [Phaeobacter inhibens]|uniref:sulfotransferase family 2 domain-containing protein n=1 Tax=Phaeobacter inhibens TaxID=221822 RepID=UPI000C9B67B2|nr:sulfotransferase family 2 domain-containing protein [Phaeobacter inhibens]AUQ68770.1 Sulfotransferase family protein [Phaeobacter inhibens]
MPLYRHGDKIILFIHVPKTGGSTIEEVLSTSGARQALKYYQRLGYAKATPQHMHWELLEHWVPEDFYDYAFMVVRHPIARMISEYRWRSEISETELPEFEIWVNRQLGRYEKNGFILDNHIRPQHEFLGPDTEVFRLEDGLERPVFIALERLGLPTDDFEIHHARKSERNLLTLTEKTLQDIRSFYATDFEVFDFDPQALPKDLEIL